ncbi:CarD family transcriptional regulator [Brevibacterium atlanticum]|uniref:CarD family transcriptional regulator n=1 Tax=Brevibacterium atlanticum TaxID=2697563 RepID=UPI002B1BD064|nr:CarD family transcriptional regulator [Brevibacterium atlanticum]
MTIEFPVENVGLIGLREPLGRSAAQSILDSMGALSQSEPENWSRRFKANEEKLASGRPERLAEVVQSLYVRKSKSELSAGERKLLLAASDLLAGELSVALGMTIDAALERIDQQLS